MERRTYLKIVVAFSATAVASSLPSCVRQNKGVSGEERASLLAALADTILPETDVPGALRAGVLPYMMDALAIIVSPRGRDRFNRGLQDVQNYAYSRYHQSFEQCSEKERLSILQYFEAKVSYRFRVLNKIHRKVFGEPFVKQLKRLVVNGYCTSQLGATEGLAYDPIPVGYEAYIPLASQPRNWATE